MSAISFTLGYMSDLSHHNAPKSHPVRTVPAGLVPPPPLNWEAWRIEVARLKEANGLSINTLTERSGLDRSTVIELLGGRREIKGIRVDTLWALAWALEIPAEDFASFLSPLTAGLSTQPTT